eukprot:COSAG04_NODE_18377_length_443_cov_1.502907_1_plen_86_part_10
MFAASSCYRGDYSSRSTSHLASLHIPILIPPRLLASPHLASTSPYNLISPPYRRALLGDLFAETVESESRQQNSQRHKLIVSALTS